MIQQPVWADPHWCLSMDLYEISMAHGYQMYGMDFPATFELTFRQLPPHRGYLIATGIETAIAYCLNLRFDQESIRFLRNLPQYRNIPETFWDYLMGFSFHGDIDAVPEGTPVFANEPVLVVRGPLPEVQLLESFLLATVNFQTMIATKASRVVRAARGRSVVDFGLRRAHSPEAGFWLARAAYIGGCDSTSNLLAGYRFGIPVVGTIAHSWILAHDTEEEAFRRFYDLFPEHAVFLVDTFDTLQGVRKVIALNLPARGIRIDSGNLSQLTRTARKLLDKSGFKDMKIILSGDLNEYIIDSLMRKKVPVDAFGVGTELAVSRDAPAMTGIYKIVEWERGMERVPRMKWSPEKRTLPGRKQVYRLLDDRGRIVKDILALHDEPYPVGVPLLKPWVRNGVLIRSLPTLDEIKKRVQNDLSTLRPQVLRFSNPAPVRVQYSPGLKRLITEARSS